MTADVRLTNIDEVSVGVDVDNVGILYELKEQFTFMVPGAQFSPKFKMKIWDGKISLFNMQKRTIYRGLVSALKTFCEERDYTVSYEDQRDMVIFKPLAEDFFEKTNPKHIPREHQVDGFLHAVNERRTLLLSPTSSGKSLIAYLLSLYFLRERGLVKGLIIVPTVNLVEQLYSDFDDYSIKNGWSVKENCHRIYEGKEKHSDCPIHISTWQSLAKMEPSYFKQFDFVIGDEAHLFTAKSLTSIMTSLTNAKYRIGMTGTLDGTKTHRLVLEGLFGPVHRVVTTSELMEAGHVAKLDIKVVLLRHSDENSKAAKDFTYPEEISYLIGNERRNNFIANLAISLPKNTIVFFQYVDKHGKKLFELIQKKTNRPVFFISGKTDVEVREEIRRIVEIETEAIIVASFGTTSTGTNIINVHNAIFASPSKGQIKNLQSIGRILRVGDGKEAATLYDIADDMRHKRHENFTLKHCAARLQIYSNEKFQFKILKINLGD